MVGRQFPADGMAPVRPVPLLDEDLRGFDRCYQEHAMPPHSAVLVAPHVKHPTDRKWSATFEQ